MFGAYYFIVAKLAYILLAIHSCRLTLTGRQTDTQTDGVKNSPIKYDGDAECSTYIKS